LFGDDRTPRRQRSEPARPIKRRPRPHRKAIARRTITVPPGFRWRRYADLDGPIRERPYLEQLEATAAFEVLHETLQRLMRILGAMPSASPRRDTPERLVRMSVAEAGRRIGRTKSQVIRIVNALALVGLIARCRLGRSTVYQLLLPGENGIAAPAAKPIIIDGQMELPFGEIAAENRSHHATYLVAPRDPTHRMMRPIKPATLHTAEHESEIKTEQERREPPSADAAAGKKRAGKNGEIPDAKTDAISLALAGRGIENPTRGKLARLWIGELDRLTRTLAVPRITKLTAAKLIRALQDGPAGWTDDRIAKEIESSLPKNPDRARRRELAGRFAGRKEATANISQIFRRIGGSNAQAVVPAPTIQTAPPAIEADVPAPISEEITLANRIDEFRAMGQLEALRHRAIERAREAGDGMILAMYSKDMAVRSPSFQREICRLADAQTQPKTNARFTAGTPGTEK
jgi:hypothetical protein